MPAQQLRGVVSFIGVLVQFGGSVFLAGLFLLLRRNAPRRSYFGIWAAAWVALSFALLTIVARYAIADALDNLLLSRNLGIVRAIFFFYQAAKLAYLVLLVAGTLAYVRGLAARAFFPPAGPLALAYAAVSVLVAGESRMVLVLQAPVAIGVFAFCAALLHRLPPSRRSLGSAVSSVAFALTGALWLIYLGAFGVAELAHRDDANALVTLLFYSSYLDVMLQALLGYGMVLVFMEDAKREADDARIELAVANNQLRRAALYDPLTGALNRRAFLEGVGLESAKATFGTALMLDLDNLKLVNDTYGHGAGDELLRQFVVLLRGELRPSDRIYRWGGDEFLLVLPGAPARAVAARVERAMATAPPVRTSDGARELPILVSHGAAEFAGAEDLADAINRADEAMYWRKNERKHRPPLRVLPVTRGA